MKVLVTGASRGAGRSIVERLAEMGHDVVGLVRKPGDVMRLSEAWRDIGARPVLGDVTDLGSLEAALQGQDGFIHAAAAVGEPGADDGHYYRVNVEGTGNVWRAAGRAGVPAGVFISSVAIYGRPDVPEVFEDAPRLPLEVPYERTKSVAEALAFRLGALLGIRTSALRPSLIYGPHDEQFIPRVYNALRSGSFVFVGNPDRSINVTASEHVASCALSALVEPAAGGEAFNVVDAELPTWREVASTVAREAKLKCPRRIIDARTALWAGTALDRLRDVGVPVGLPALTRFNARAAGNACVYRIDKARKVLAYRPTRSFLRDGFALVRQLVGG